MEAAAIYTNDDPGVEEEIVCCFEIADVFISVLEKDEVSNFGVLDAGLCHKCLSCSLSSLYDILRGVNVHEREHSHLL